LLSGLLCYEHPSCKYWTWVEEIDGNPTVCNLKYANEGLIDSPASISGGKYCLAATGNDSEPYQHLFPLFLTKSNKVYWKHAPNFTPSTFTATFDSKLAI
jgi:hypothetical protein